MAKIKYTLAMLSLGGLATAGAASAVTPVTVTLNIAGDVANSGFTPIDLVGGTGTESNPQFEYGNYFGYPYLLSGPFTTAYTKGFIASQYGAVGDKSSTNPGVPVFSDVVDQSPAEPILGEPTYFQLAFDNGSQEYVGYGYVDSSETLEYITYEAVPEPAAWALLIAGVGLAGAAVRTRRRKELAQAA